MSLSLPPLSQDHIFGCGPDSTSAAAGRKTPTTVTFRDNNGGGALESPSRVLGGSTSWTGGLSHGCTAVFKNNETRTGLCEKGNCVGGTIVG